MTDLEIQERRTIVTSLVALSDARRHELSAALHLSKSVSLLIGNLANQRNAWIIISVLNGIRQDEALTLFEDVA